MSRGIAVALLALAVGCGAGPARTAAPPKPANAILVISCDVADATIWVDDREAGLVGELRRGIGVPPGTHRLEVSHDEYHTYYDEVVLAEGERRTVNVALAPELH
jgi:hypothetical protein